MEQYVDENIPADYFIKINGDPEELLLKLDKTKLKRLQKVWDGRDEGLGLGEFVKIMLNEIPSNSIDEKLQMMHGFIKFFQSVDINGDGSMEWGELIQSIIDTVVSESVKRQIDFQNQKTLEIHDQLQKANDEKFTRISKNQTVDKGKHRKKIFDVIFCEEVGNGTNKPHTQTVIHSEIGSNCIQFYSTNMKLLKKVEVPVKIAKSNLTSICFRDMSKESSNFGPVGTSSFIAATASDGYIHIYAQIHNRLEYWKAIQTDQIQDRIWYLPYSKWFVTAGLKDFKLRIWNISPFVKNPLVGEPLSLHTQEVTDLIEIKHPPCIITCSMDKTIKMYSLDRQQIIRTFPEHHTNGIRQLKYIAGFGGHLASRGFEINICLWGPENLFGDPFIGMLKGHQQPIITMDDLKTQPYLVTMDQSSEIIIWDVRTMFQMQNIPPKHTKELIVNGIFCLNKNKVWLYGTRFFEFDRFEDQRENLKDQLQLYEEKIPTNAFYNEFFNLICVLSGNQLKLFNVEDGRMNVLHQNLFKNSKEIPLAIDQDKRNRKVYVSSNHGAIKVLNIINGVILKDVFEAEGLKRAITKAIGTETIKNIEAKAEGDDKTFLTGLKIQQQTGPTPVMNEESKEIIDLQLVWEEEMIQLIYCDKKSIYIFDEAQEESELLRTLTGAHNTDNITKLKYDYHFSLIATGSNKGRVAVWDYELSQLLAFCVGHSNESEITAIEFCSPYPIMITCATDGRICFWTVRPVPYLNSYICLASFDNYTFNGEIEDLSAIKSISVYKGEMTGIEKGFHLFHYQLPATIYRDYITSQVLALQEDNVIKDMQGRYRGPQAVFNARIEILEKYSQKDRFGFTLTETEFAKLKNNPPYPVQSKAELIDPNYQENLAWKKDRFYIYTGDSEGYIKLWDLTHLLASFGFEKAKPFTSQKSTFIPGRKENVDVSSVAIKLLKQAETNRVTLPESRRCHSLIIRETLAHDQSVLRIQPHGQGGIISCGRDLKVNVWSSGLDLWGVLDQENYKVDSLWKFPVKNAREKVEEEIQQIQELLEEVGLSSKVGTLVADRDFKDEKYEEGIDYTLGKLRERHARMEILKTKKELEKKKQREQEKQDWLKIMAQGSGYKEVVPFQRKPPFDRLLFKIQMLENFMIEMKEEEDRIVAAADGCTIVPRIDMGLAKKVNDKLEEILKEKMKMWLIQKKINDGKEVKNVVNKRNPRKKISIVHQSKLSIDSHKNSIQSFESNSASPNSPQKLSPSRSDLPKNLSSPIKIMDSRDSSLPRLKLEKVKTTVNQLTNITEFLSQTESDASTQGNGIKVRKLEELNQTGMLIKKLQKVKKTNEANPQAMQHDREKIKELKNLPSLRQALDSIKSSRQKVLENDKLVCLTRNFQSKTGRTINQENNFYSQESQREQMQSIFLNAPAYGPGHKFSSRSIGMRRNGSGFISKTYENSIKKFNQAQEKKGNETPFQPSKLKVNSRNMFENRNHSMMETRIQYSSEVKRNKKTRTPMLGIDPSSQNLIMNSYGEEQSDQPIIIVGKRDKDLKNLQSLLTDLDQNDSAQLMSLQGSFEGSSVMAGLPNIRTQFDPNQLDKKKSQESNPYNSATSASRNAKMTAEQSILTIGSREVSYDASSSRIQNNLSSIFLNQNTTGNKTKENSKINNLQNIFSTVNFQPISLSRLINSPPVEPSKFDPSQIRNLLPKDASIQQLEFVTFQGPDQKYQSFKTRLTDKEKKANNLKSQDGSEGIQVIEVKQSNYFKQRGQSYSVRKQKYIGADSILSKIQREEAIKIQQQRERIADLKALIKL